MRDRRRRPTPRWPPQRVARARRPGPGGDRQRRGRRPLRPGRPGAGHRQPGGQLHAVRDRGGRAAWTATRCIDAKVSLVFGTKHERGRPGPLPERPGRRGHQPDQAGVAAHARARPGSTSSTSTSRGIWPSRGCSRRWPAWPQATQFLRVLGCYPRAVTARDALGAGIIGRLCSAHLPSSNPMPSGAGDDGRDPRPHRGRRVPRVARHAHDPHVEGRGRGLLPRPPRAAVLRRPHRLHVVGPVRRAVPRGARRDQEVARPDGRDRPGQGRGRARCARSSARRSTTTPRTARTRRRRRRSSSATSSAAWSCG